MRGAGRLGRLLAGCRPGSGPLRAAEAQASSLASSAASLGSEQQASRLAQASVAARRLHGGQQVLRAQQITSAADLVASEQDAAVSDAVREILSSDHPSEAAIERAADIALQEATRDEAAATGIQPPTPAADLPLPAHGSAAPRAEPATAAQAAGAAASGELAAAAAAAAEQAPADPPAEGEELSTSSNEVLQRWITAWTAFSAKLAQHDYYETREHQLDSLSMCACCSCCSLLLAALHAVYATCTLCCTADTWGRAALDWCVSQLELPAPETRRKEMNTVKRAWLNFARARPDFMFSLPPHKVVALIQEPLPYEEDKVRPCPWLAQCCCGTSQVAPVGCWQ